MLKRSWSVGRMMAAVVIMAVGLTALLALRSRQNMDDPGVGVLAMVLALILMVATDRTLFGQRHRAFWLGFTVVGWVCAAASISYLQETRSYLLHYGPPLARERDMFQRRVIFAMHRGAQLPERPSEWYLLGSLIAELGFGLTLGALAATMGGLLASGASLLARHSTRRAQRLKVG